MKTDSLLLAFVCGISLAVSPSTFADEQAGQAEFKGLTLSQWIERLAKGRFEDTPAAWDDPPTEALEALPNFGADAIPPLIEALESESPFVRYNATTALQRIKANRKTAVPALTKLLQDEHVPVRTGAADTLHSIGPDAAAAIPELEKLLDETEEHSAGKAIPLVHGRRFFWSPCNSARWALIAIGPESVPVFLKRLKSEDEDIRTNAVLALWEFSGLPQVVVPELIRALEDESPSVRGNAARVLGSLGEVARTATPVLTKYVTDRDDYTVTVSLHFGDSRTVGQSSIAALKAIGPTSEDVSKLIEILTLESEKPPTETSPYVRRSIVELLADCQEQSQTIIPVLTTALDDEELRYAAALSLLRLKSNHPRIRIMLLECLHDVESRTSHWFERLRAVAVVRDRKWADDNAVTALKAAQQDETSQVRLIAAGTLLGLGDDPTRAQAVFGECLLDCITGREALPVEYSEEIWQEILTTLRKSPRAAELAVPYLIGWLESRRFPQTDDLQRVVTALAITGHYGAKQVPRLSDHLEASSDYHHRRIAAFALGFVGNKNRRAASALLYGLHDPDAPIREAAAESLGRIGVKEGIVLSELTTALDDKSQAVRQQSAEALKLLKAQPAPQ